MKFTLRPPNRVLARQLETERFVLQPLGMRAAIRLTLDWRHDLEIVTGLYMTPGPMSVVQWLRVAPIPNNVDRFTFAIVPRGEVQPIGVHMVRFRGSEAARNMVALSDRDWWGKGVVLEVRAALMTHFFQHTAIDRFEGGSNRRNAASIFNYRRLGYELVRTRQHKQRDADTGAPIEVLEFAMSREKWFTGPFAGGADVG